MNVMPIKTHRWEDVRRSTPEQVAEHRRWAKFASGASLADLRQLAGLTQEELGARVGVSGVEVGRAEKRSDLQLSTLRRYLEAMGLELEVWVHHPSGAMVPFKTGAVEARAQVKAAPSRSAARRTKGPSR
jgi:transcriptional regulator with XRE-family HTH domain